MADFTLDRDLTKTPPPARPLGGFTLDRDAAGPAPGPGFTLDPKPIAQATGALTAQATGELAPAPAGLSAVFAPAPKLEETVVPSVLNGKTPELVVPNVMDPDAFPNPWQTTPIEPPKPVDTGSGFFSGLGAGVPAGAKDVGAALTGNAFAPVPDPETSFGPSPAMGEPQRGFWNELGYGMGHNLGGIVAGAGGAAAGGTAVGGPVGTLGGAALGTFLGTAAADLRPNYLTAIQQGKTHDEAVDYAIQRTLTSSGIYSTLGVIPGPIRGAIGQMLWQAILQPGVGAVNRIATPMVMGEPQPTNEQLTRGAGQDLAASILFGALHAGMGAGRAQPRPPETETRPPEPSRPATPLLEPRTIEGDYTVVTPPGELGAPRAEPPPPTGPRAPGLPSETPPPETPVPGQRQEPIPPSMEPTPPVGGPITVTMPEQPGVPPAVRTEEPAPAVQTAPLVPAAGEPTRPATSSPVSGTSPAPAPLPPSPTESAAPQTEQPLPPEVPSGAPPVAPAERPAAQSPAEVPQPVSGTERLPEPSPPRPPAVAEPPAAEPTPARPVAEPVYTTEPDHLDPNRQVAKNEAGEVVGKGATPEEAAADAQARGGQVYPAEPAAAETAPVAEPAARAPADYLKLDPNIRAEEYVRRLAELRDNKPRPINKLWRNPETAPPEQVEAAREALRAWNREYRIVARNQKLAETRDNEAFRARGAQPLADQGLVPGPAEAPGTKSAQREQLDKLIATRDALNQKPRTPAEQRKFQAVERQIAVLEQQLAKTEGAPAQVAAPRTTEDSAGTPEAEARGGRKVPFQGPEPVGRPRNLLDFKFNDGTSVFRSVFEEAGHDPNLAQSYPIDRQVRILAQHQKDLFGFREVRVPGRRGMEPTRVELHQAAEAMLDTTRAFKDGMAAVGLPHEAVSNHGQLALEYVPKGSTNYFGAYVFDGTIKVQSGANAYGHEWTHAIDHMLAERFTNNPAHMNKLLSQYARDSGLDTRDNVQAAFAKLINTLFYNDVNLATRRLALEVDAQKVDRQGNPTKQALNAQEQLVKLEGAGSKLRIHSSEFRKLSAQFQPAKADYWASVYEMLARSHEAYLSRKMQQQGLDPRGFVMPDEAYVNMVDRQLNMAYPKQAERDAIFHAWDEVHQAMNQEAILSNGKPPGDFADYGPSDPHHWRITAPNTRKTELAQQIRAEINRYKNLTFRQFRDQMFGLDPNRPPPLPGHTRGSRMLEGFRTLTYAYSSMMRVIIKRAPPEAGKILQPLLDSVATAPGQGRVIHETFEERVRDQSNGMIQQYANILRNHGFDPTFDNMTTEERLMLRHLLTGGGTTMPSPNDPTQTVAIPKKIQEAHADVRDLLNRVWNAAADAGLNIGYAKSGFFPRTYDRARAASDPATFKKDAGELYSLMFDREIGAPGADPQALWEKWNTLPRASQQLAGQGNAPLPNQMGELKQNLARQREIEAKPNPTPAEQAELTKLQGEAEQLAITAHPGLRDFISEVNAADWHANLTGGRLTDFDTSAPSGRYLNARELPPEADQIMARGGFLHLDPHVVLPAYFHSVARRIAQAKLFGANDEVLHEAVAKLNRIPGMSGDDTTKFMTLINDLVGKTNNAGWHRWVQTPHNVAHAAGTLALMERAVWSSMTEPMNAAMVTKEFTAGFRNMGYTIARLLDTAGSRDRTMLAEYLNAVQSPMLDSIMLSRMGSDVNDAPGFNKINSNFYKSTFLTQITNAQRAATIGTNHWFLTKLAQHVLDKGTDTGAAHGRDDAARWFRELGMPDDIHDTFSQMLVDMGGKLPTPRELIAANESNRYGGMGDAYSLAMRRLTDRIIQAPAKVDRAVTAGVPGLGLAFQLMSFNYAYWKNVLLPALNFEHVFERAKGEAQAAGAGRIKANLKGAASVTGPAVNTAAIIASVVGAAILQSFVRQMIYNPEAIKKHQEEGDLLSYLVDLGVARSGLNGVLDPILQAWNNLKYDADIASLVHGASLNSYLQNLQRVLYPVLGKDVSDNTNTAKYNQAKAFYNLVGVPLTALGLTALGAQGPVSRLVSYPFLTWFTSPAAADKFATTVAGPKGQTRPEGGGGMPNMPGMPKMPGMPGMPKLGGGGGGDAEKSKSGGNSMWQMGMGLADDLLVPASRFIAPMIAQTSLPLKVGMGVAGAGYGAYKYLESTAPFRNNPNPPPKRGQ